MNVTPGSSNTKNVQQQNTEAKSPSSDRIVSEIKSLFSASPAPALNAINTNEIENPSFRPLDFFFEHKIIEDFKKRSHAGLQEILGKIDSIFANKSDKLTRKNKETLIIIFYYTKKELESRKRQTSEQKNEIERVSLSSLHSSSAPPLGHMSPKEKAIHRYEALGPEHWRVYIDAKHLSSVPSNPSLSRRRIYNEGRHGGTAEKQYYKSMKAADSLVLSTIGKPLDFNLYFKIHEKTMEHREGEAKKIREGTSPIHLPVKDFDDGVKEQAEEYLIFSAENKDGLCEITHRILDVPYKFHKIMSKYYNGINKAETSEEKLQIIAQTHLCLEWLHAFNDGNSRTNKLVLNKMLAENDLDLCILDTPLGVEQKNLTTWLSKIKDGQTRWKQCVDNIPFEDRERYKLRQERVKQEQKDAAEMKKSISESDTSSGEDIKDNELKSRRNAIAKLKLGDLDGALRIFKESKIPSYDMNKLIFDNIFLRANNNKDQGLMRKLIKHFVVQQKVNTDSYKGPQLHLWVAESLYGLFLLSNKQNNEALKAARDHINLIFKKTTSKEFLEKAKLLRDKMDESTINL